MRQILDDPAGDHDWGISAEIDLAASDELGAAAVRVTRVGLVEEMAEELACSPVASGRASARIRRARELTPAQCLRERGRRATARRTRAQPRQPFLHDLTILVAAPSQVFSSEDGGIGRADGPVGVEGCGMPTSGCSAA